MGSLHPVAVFNIFFFLFSSSNSLSSKSLFLLGNTICTVLCLQLIVSQLLQNLSPGLFNHRFICFSSFHHKFLSMLSDLLERKSPHYLQTILTTFDAKQLSHWFLGTVIHTQTLTAWHLHIYRTLLVAPASVHTLGSMNKLLLSIVSIWPASPGNKEESQPQN